MMKARVHRYPTISTYMQRLNLIFIVVPETSFDEKT